MAEKCRVCEGQGGTSFSSRGWTYVRCGKCGTLGKQLSFAEYQAMEPGYDPGLYLRRSSEKQLRASLDVEGRKEILTSIAASIGRDPSGVRLLDVGCGMGGYLLAGRELGMIVEGFEPSEIHSTVGRQILNLDIKTDYFSSGKVGGRKFDIVMLSHVIEHIYWPRPFIEQLASVVADGGVLQIITPNANSVIARITGAAWPMLLPIDHVTMLSANSIEYLTPTGWTGVVKTSEYPFEFFATLGSVVKSKLFGRRAVRGTTASEAPSPLLDIGLKGRAVRLAMAAASAPVRLLALSTNRGACLVVTFRRAPGVRSVASSPDHAPGKRQLHENRDERGVSRIGR
jgi:SAM-dependent methyltransferase